MGAAQGVVFLGGHPTKLMAYAVEELLTWYPLHACREEHAGEHAPDLPADPRQACQGSDPDHSFNSLRI